MLEVLRKGVSQVISYADQKHLLSREFYFFLTGLKFEQC